MWSVTAKLHNDKGVCLYMCGGSFSDDHEEEAREFFNRLTVKAWDEVSITRIK